MTPEVVIIAAVAEDGTIGDGGSIPWDLPGDLERFRRLTTGHPVVMGRRTFESLDGPLPDRPNVVLSRSMDLRPGAHVCRSLGSAMDLARSFDTRRVFVAGGAGVYAQTIHVADRMELTRVPGEYGGDARFPDFDASSWDLEHVEPGDGCYFETWR